MRYTHAFFDLDGTISNSAPGITHSVQYALAKMGIAPPPAEELLGFIGPALTWGFSHFFDMNEEDSKRAVGFYRENYRASGMLECEIYEEIPALLRDLNDAGVTCVLTTAKPHVFANQILAHFGLDRYFAGVFGPELDGTRGEKHEVIAHALTELGLTDPSKILMIGDRHHDALGSRRYGIACAGVLWGFGSKEELTEAGAAYLCASPAELKALLLQ
ncbi:MAG: HAD hydrolase-like protein [Clostridia bacterium]|nr:HAD hydrolase-like protein [Clostridia bacterium]